MKQQHALALIPGLLLIGFVSIAQAVTLNVTIQGSTLPQATNAALAKIVLTNQVFGPITVTQVDTAKGDARIEAEENVNGTRDELRIVNAKFTRTQDPQGAPLNISLSADFGPIPDGSVAFNMSTQSVKFKRGVSSITSGGCAFTISGSITVQTVTTALQGYTYNCRNNVPASFNWTGSGINIDTGTNNNRTHTQQITYTLPMDNDYMELPNTVTHLNLKKKRQPRAPAATSPKEKQ